MPGRMIQRAFLSLLEENRSRFAIKIKLGRRNDGVQQFAFAGINSAVSGVLSTYEISVYVMHQGACWDFLLDVDTELRRVPAAMFATSARRNLAPVFPALWTDHLFEPFLEWVNESLAKAKWLAL